MSYEGYYQLLCEDGHLSEIDAYDGPEICSCNKPPVFSNSVDETNCGGRGVVKFDVVAPGESEICNLGHKHRLSPGVMMPVTDVDGFILNFHECDECGHPPEDRVWVTSTNISDLKVTDVVKALWKVK